MTNIGRILENPVTGERFSVMISAADSGGELLQMDFFAKPHGHVAVEHIHPRQEERFRILSGGLHLRVAGVDQHIHAGQEVAVPPGVSHVWWNDSDDEEAHFIVEFRPALNIEQFFQIWFGLARDGKTDKHGKPNPLQLAVIGQEYRNEVGPSLPVDRLLIKMAPIIAPIGRLLGYRAHYPVIDDRTSASRSTEAAHEPVRANRAAGVDS